VSPAAMSVSVVNVTAEAVLTTENLARLSRNQRDLQKALLHE